LASFSRSAAAVRLYPPVILRRHAVWTFWSGLRSDLGGPFSVSLIAQMLDPYVMVGRTTAVYSRRDLWKHGPHVESKVIYLGLIISYNKIKIGPKKITAIINWESLSNI